MDVPSFRTGYLNHAQLTATLRGFADAHPTTTRLTSIGTSAEGRDLWVLTIGRDLDRPRPAVWVDGNMHAMELTGSSAALAIAEEAIAIVEGAPSSTVSSAARARLQDVVFHIAPRMSPDGAEAVLTSGRFVRSRPHDARLHKGRARWLHQDVDGDGLALWMRKIDDAGDFVESQGVMVPRTIDDEGPAYKLWPEGIVENWDGRHVPPWSFLGDGPDDFNRNFPWSWAPVEDQEGAGDFPGSAPEVRAVMAYATAHPELFVWLNLHTFGGVLIRPLGHAGDAKMDQGDLAVFRQIEAWGKEHLGYPTVSGFDEFCYSPERPIRGDVSDFGYHQRGCVSFSLELWDYFKQVGVEPHKPFVGTYNRFTRAQLEALGRWDREKNAGRGFVPWKKAHHPQLGDVEVGGFDGRVGTWNPPYDQLDAVCRGTSALFLRMAAMVPRVSLTTVQRDLGGAVQIDVVVKNDGYLATYGLPSHRKLAISEPLVVECEASLGARVVSAARVDVGHLEGWGRGLYGAMSAPPYQATIAEQSERSVSFVVEGKGAVRLRAGSCRIGRVEATLRT